MKYTKIESIITHLTTNKDILLYCRAELSLPHHTERAIYMFHVINTNKAPQAIGPYSQGIIAGNLLFTSGQLPINPNTNTMPNDIIEQTHQCLNNLLGILESAHCSLKDVVKTTIFITDMAKFEVINETYHQYFSQPFPCRSLFEVSKLPKNAKIKIEACAVLNDKT